jgi:hypothetical protein
MTFRACSYEKELAQALKDGHWPQSCGEELRAHVNECGKCGDLILVTQTFQGARRESERVASADCSPSLLSPSLLWWRAQLRRRNAAADRVSRPITIAQTFAWLVTLLVGVVFVASQYRHGLRWMSWWSELALGRALHLLSNGVGQAGWNPLLVISGFGVLALLSGVVVYLASEKS